MCRRKCGFGEYAEFFCFHLQLLLRCVPYVVSPLETLLVLSFELSLLFV